MTGYVRIRFWNRLKRILLVAFWSLLFVAFQNCQPISQHTSPDLGNGDLASDGGSGQNASGGSTNGDTNSSGTGDSNNNNTDNTNNNNNNTNTIPPACQNITNKAPLVESVTVNGKSVVNSTVDVKVGMGDDAGSDQPIVVQVSAYTSVNKDEGSNQDLDLLDCDNPNSNGLNIDCNNNFQNQGGPGRYTGTIRITSNDECISKTVKVTLRVRDRITGECSGQNTDLRKFSNTVSFNIRAIDACLPTKKLIPQTPVRNGKFGSRVSIDGNYAVAVASGDTANGSDSGAAYVFFYNGSSWIQQARLLPSDGASGDELLGVDIDGSTIVLGAPYHQVSGRTSGAAYVFTRSGSSWNQVAKLVPNQPNPSSYDAFGFDVAVSGSTVAVGAFGDNSKGNEAGAVYVFNGSQYSQVQKITPSDIGAYDNFGMAVDIEGSTLVAGAPVATDASPRVEERVYVYNISGGSSQLIQTLTASDGKASEIARLGQSLSLSGSTLVVGAPWAPNGNRNKAGKAYVFTKSGSKFAETQILQPQDRNPEDLFGYSVSVSGNHLAIGAPWQEERQGAVYHFKKSGSQFAQNFKIRPREDDRDKEDRFGESVAVSGSRAICGATLDDYDPGNSIGFQLNAGRGFVFDLP